MTKTFNDLIAEADQIIDKHTTKTAAQTAIQQADDVFKLAEELIRPADDSKTHMTMIEKVAHAFALVDTVINLPEIVKLAQFEEEAMKKGISPDRIAGYFEKNASAKFKSALTLLED